jgi:5-methyltetrahydrofolate--homocysteine methyltransferase
MAALLDHLRERKILVADGAMGTMLFQRGLSPGECPERMNLEHPEFLEEIARLYVEAGAEIIQTNTFGGSPIKLAMYHLDNRTEEINIAAVRAAKKGAGGKAFVTASCGPCGKLLKPYGDTDPAEVLAGFERQISALVSENIDMISVETMTDLHEALLAVKAAKSIAPSIPVSATMTFDSTPKGFYTIMGVTVEQAAKELAEAGADIIGSNCGNGIENMVGIAAEFRKYSDLPLLIRPNAGLPRMNGDALVYPESPEFMAEKCRAMLPLGLSILGGCCGTTPEHIAAFRREVQRYLSK